MLKRWVSKFWHDKRGYVIALTLIAMPLLLGFSLLVIDASRGENLHTDLQDAVDAMALAGARQLDGRDDAIARAKNAVADLTNSASFVKGGSGMSLGGRITVTYNTGDTTNGCDLSSTASTVCVLFLKGIPTSDDSGEWTGSLATFLGTYGTTDSNDASYVRVIAKPQSMQTIFPIPVSLRRDTVDISAEATAVYAASACNVMPIYICNPFESNPDPDPTAASDAFHQAFANGGLYGVQFELHNSGNYEVGPGNFGFLQTDLGTGASALREALATGSTGVCYKQRSLGTEPGAMTGPVEQGINTRFGLYGGAMNSDFNDPAYRPAQNVRMGQSQSGQSCKSYSAVSDPCQAVPLGYGANMSDIAGGGGRYSTDPTTGAPADNWNLNWYWYVSHSTKPNKLGCTSSTVAPAAPSTVLDTIRSDYSSYPTGTTPDSVTPSAYDVYQYEMSGATGNNATTLVGDQSPSKETGTPQCYKSYNLSDYPDSVYRDRRTIFAAIVNCVHENPQGRDKIQALAFARMFLTKPAVTDGSTRYLSLETIDITGQGGMGTLDTYLREESELIR